jgi:flagellar basal-body rod modification protein FlgD
MSIEQTGYDPAVGSAAQTGSEVTNHTGRLANQDVFMRLLVAQLQYQNPMNPADGVEFMTQLTQFSQLEQAMGTRQELVKIRQLLESTPAAG